ncbi:hypothetical protein D9M68_863770 [compost metagenome]
MATNAEPSSSNRSSQGQGFTPSTLPRPRWVKKGITRPPISPIIAATSQTPASTPWRCSTSSALASPATQTASTAASSSKTATMG